MPQDNAGGGEIESFPEGDSLLEVVQMRGYTRHTSDKKQL